MIYFVNKHKRSDTVFNLDVSTFNEALLYLDCVVARVGKVKSAIVGTKIVQLKGHTQKIEGLYSTVLIAIIYFINLCFVL